MLGSCAAPAFYRLFAKEASQETFLGRLGLREAKVAADDRLQLLGGDVGGLALVSALRRLRESCLILMIRNVERPAESLPVPDTLGEALPLAPLGKNSLTVSDAPFPGADPIRRK
jgi:hypothetical protein